LECYARDLSAQSQYIQILGACDITVDSDTSLLLGKHLMHMQEEAQALKQRLSELEADHKAAIAAHSALEEHLDSQAAAEKELAALRCAHAELEADHARAIAAHASLEERLFSTNDYQRRHDSLKVCCQRQISSSLFMHIFVAGLCMPAAVAIFCVLQQSQKHMLPAVRHAWEKDAIIL